ncbi:MAG: PorT family protein [Bacteroidia bacterium]|nr:PorT family protein [Bacteroidia bacterium]
MKKSNSKSLLTSLVIAFLLTVTMSSNAQKAEFGVRYMPTFSSFDIQSSSGGVIKGEMTLGHGFGALLGFNFSEHAGIQVEVIYSPMSQEYKENDADRKITLNYVNIPLLLSLNTGKTKPVNLNFVVGPQIGISVGSEINSTSNNGTSSTEAVLAVKKGDLGFAYGAGLDFGLNTERTFRLGIGFRGVKGLIDISDNSETSSNESYYVLDKTQISTYAGYIGFSILF